MDWEVSAGTCHCHTYWLPIIIIGGPAVLHCQTVTFVALGGLHSSLKLVCGARYGSLGGMIRIQPASDKMLPQTKILDAVASRGTSTPLLGATCGLSQVTFVKIKGLALQKAGMLGARLALPTSSAQTHAMFDRACFSLWVGGSDFCIPKCIAAANLKSKSRLICGAHCAPTFTVTP